MNVKRIAFVLAISFLSHNAHGSTWAKIDPNAVKWEADDTIDYIFQTRTQTQDIQDKIALFKRDCLPRVVAQVMQCQFKTEHEAKERTNKLTIKEANTFYLTLFVEQANKHIHAINANGPGRLENGFRLSNHLKKLETMFDITFAK